MNEITKFTDMLSSWWPKSFPSRFPMTFMWPSLLWLLLAVPLLVAVYWWLLRRKKKASLRFASLSIVREAMDTGPGFRRHIPPILFLLAITLMLLAASRPFAVVTLPMQQETIMLAMDVSGSMRATDVLPSRIVAAQNAAKAFLTELPRNIKVGIVAFAGSAQVAQIPTLNREDLISAIDRFQQLYPNHPGTDYMLYLKGLINFTPASAFMTNLTGQDPAERDPKGLRASYDAFAELLKRYPNSRYAADAQQRMTWLVNAIAMNEVYVARYYYERGAYLAAANRAQTVITDFEGVPAAEEALYILQQSYGKLGMKDLEADASRVLSKNYPNSKFETEGLAAEKSWWNPFSR